MCSSDEVVGAQLAHGPWPPFREQLVRDREDEDWFMRSQANADEVALPGDRRALQDESDAIRLRGLEPVV